MEFKAKILKFKQKVANLNKNSPGFYNFSILARFYQFSVLTGTVFQDSHRFYHFRELGRILLFFDTRVDSTISGTRSDSTIFRYS